MTRIDAFKIAARRVASTFETQAIVYHFNQTAPADGYNVRDLVEAVDLGESDDVVELITLNKG